MAGSQHRRESAPAARLRVQDLDLSDRAVALGQLLAAGGDDAASDDRGLEAAARNLDGSQPLPAARVGVEALDDVEIESAGPPGA